MKILIISGFLGAGKTTFIKELIRRTDKRLVVLENEYGSADIDQQLIGNDDQADVWDLTEGCVCCTKSADLNASVVTIESTLEPEFLIVEPSGVGALGNVIRNLRKIEYERIALLRPLTIVDAEHFMQDCMEFPDICESQIKAAGTVVISKPDNPDPQLFDIVEAKVREINPDAELIPRHYTKMPQDWWDSLLVTAPDGRDLKEVDESALDLETYTIANCRAYSPVSLLWLLEQAVRGRFGEILRAKGVMPAGKDWVSFDIVNGKISIAGVGGIPENMKPECTWIGRAIDRLLLRKFLADPKFLLFNDLSPQQKESDTNKTSNITPIINRYKKGVSWRSSFKD